VDLIVLGTHGRTGLSHALIGSVAEKWCIMPMSGPEHQAPQYKFISREPSPAGMERKYPDLPIVGVGGVLFDGDRVLLVKRGKEPGLGQWSIPGGWFRWERP